jgi:multiple sugar transport system ATP-binding protein
MHDGVIHQVGSPDEIYDRPVDRFVASFIGTPPMNFIDGAVSNGVFTCEDGETIPVPGLSHEGSAVLGIRPEAIGFGQGAIRGVVETVERLGDRMDVVMTGLGGTMTARVSVSDPIAAGEVCSFEVSHVGVHVFEPGDVGARVS